MSVTCLHCNGVGFVRQDLPVGHPDFGKLIPCPDAEAHGIERRAELYAQSGLLATEHYPLGELVYTHKLHQKTVGTLEEFLAEPQGWLFLWGGYGTVKSIALMCAVSTYIERGKAAYYSLFADLLDVVKRSFRKPEEGEKDFDEAWSKWRSYEARFHRLRHIPLLAIDEVDAAKLNPTPWMRQFQDQLFEYRYRVAFTGGGPVTIFASNNSPRQLPGWFSSRVYDKRFTVFKSGGPDVRKQMEWFHEK